MGALLIADIGPVGLQVVGAEEGLPHHSHLTAAQGVVAHRQHLSAAHAGALEHHGGHRGVEEDRMGELLVSDRQMLIDGETQQGFVPPLPRQVVMQTRLVELVIINGETVAVAERDGKICHRPTVAEALRAQGVLKIDRVAHLQCMRPPRGASGGRSQEGDAPHPATIGTRCG